MQAGRRAPIGSCSGRCGISSRNCKRRLTMTANEELLIGLVSISDRASSGVYQDEGIPALEEWLARALASPWRTETRLIPDERPLIESTLADLADRVGCHLVLTTGGTGPAPRDVTPEATLAVADKLMPGFGEQMRRIGLEFVPTAILSRQVAVVRKCSQRSKSKPERTRRQASSGCTAWAPTATTSRLSFPSSTCPKRRSASSFRTRRCSR